MTAAQRAKEVVFSNHDLVAMDFDSSIENAVADTITAAETAAYDAALADAARTLRRCGSLNAAKLIEALAEDRKRVRAGGKTGYEALQASVLLPR